MLSATWLKNTGNRDIKSCLPSKVQEKCKIKIYHLINCEHSSEIHFLALNTALFTKFKGYKKLFENISTFRIISTRQAEKIFKAKHTGKPFVKKCTAQV